MDPLPKINKVYSLVVQEESNFAVSNHVAPNSDESNVLVNASVEFSSHKCVIQDLTSKKTIGLGDQANGLL
jgi:hypothetical protein